ncbi:hypothetical protein ACFQE0_19355 [Methylobacterium komagatae]|uniref:Uncharacterized protein n=1 Tax=Methylobacterium komagatae TaxID=374425 RepID=A0ABW2BQG2_9HYPH
MRRPGSIAVLAAMAWLGLGAAIDASGSLRPPQAEAQGSLTPPAGQPRVTAPGGLRGRAIRRHHRHHAPHRRR